VIVSDAEIDYPKAMNPDLLLAMNQKSCDDFYSDLKPEGVFIVDSTFVTQLPTSKVYQIPFTRIAREKFKREMVEHHCPWSPHPIHLDRLSKSHGGSGFGTGTQRDGEIEPGCPEGWDRSC
jgi:hypothetical protein